MGKEADFEQLKTLKTCHPVARYIIVIYTCETAGTINERWLGHPQKILCVAEI